MAQRNSSAWVFARIIPFCAADINNINIPNYSSLQALDAQQQFIFTLAGARINMFAGYHFSPDAPPALPARKSSQASSRRHSGQAGSQAGTSTSEHDKLLEQQIKGLPFTVCAVDSITVVYQRYVPTTALWSKLAVQVRDIEILDHLVTSKWNKFLTHLQPDEQTNPRESDSNMLTFEMKGYHLTADSDDSVEYRLKVSFVRGATRGELSVYSLNFYSLMCYHSDSISISTL